MRLSALFGRLSIALGGVILFSLPSYAQAFSFREALDVFSLMLYAAIGLFGAATVLLLVLGYGVYLFRAGIESRTEGIRIIEWAVAIMFVLTILAIILKLIQ